MKTCLYTTLFAVVLSMPALGTESTVAASGLQAAINAATSGDIIDVTAGTSVTGTIRLLPNSGASIIIRSTAWRQLPPDGYRVTPAMFNV